MTESTPSVTKAKDLPRSVLESRVMVLSAAVSALKGMASGIESEQEEWLHQAENCAWMLCEYTNALTDLYLYEVGDEQPDDISENWQQELERLAK